MIIIPSNVHTRRIAASTSPYYHPTALPNRFDVVGHTTITLPKPGYINGLSPTVNPGFGDSGRKVGYS